MGTAIPRFLYSFLHLYSATSDTPVSLHNCETGTGLGGIIFLMTNCLNSSEYLFCISSSRFALHKLIFK